MVLTNDAMIDMVRRDEAQRLAEADQRAAIKVAMAAKKTAQDELRVGGKSDQMLGRLPNTIMRLSWSNGKPIRHRLMKKGSQYLPSLILPSKRMCTSWQME